MATISDSEAPNLQQVDLTTLNIQQLSALKQQIDQVGCLTYKRHGVLKFVCFKELTLFQDSLASLKVAQTKFQNSGECMDKLNPESEGKDILVPLTGSVSLFGYVSPRLVNFS